MSLLSQTSKASLKDLEKMSTHARKLAKEVINMRKSVVSHNANVDTLVKAQEVCALSFFFPRKLVWVFAFLGGLAKQLRARYRL